MRQGDVHIGGVVESRCLDQSTSTGYDFACRNRHARTGRHNMHPRRPITTYTEQTERNKIQSGSIPPVMPEWDPWSGSSACSRDSE